jgi:hypothetical protein
LIKQTELLAEDETVAGHSAMVDEHEQLVKKDREGPKGLFRGLFRAARQTCPYCAEEMHHGACSYCGYNTNGEEEFSDQDSYAFDELSEHTVSDDQDEDFDMEDVDHGFDGELPEDAYEEEEPYYNFLDEFNGDVVISPHHRHAMIHQYLNQMTDLGNGYPSSIADSNYAPASHSMAGSRNTHRRSYAASTVSDFVDTEMNTVIEEEDEDEDNTSSSQNETSSLDSESHDDADLVNDMSPEYTMASPRYHVTSLHSVSNSQSEDESEAASSQSTATHQFQRESSSQSTQSDASSARSTPIPTRTIAGAPSRRRQRESNTPTSSIGQPRQRRRIGSVINLAAASSQASASSVSRQSSIQPESTSETVSTSSEEDVSDGSSSGDTVDGYVSLDDDTDPNSDGAETTVGLEDASNTSVTQRSQNSSSSTIDGPTTARSQSNLRSAQPHVLRSSRQQQQQQQQQQQSLPSANSSTHYEDNDADVSDADQIVNSRSAQSVRSTRSRVFRRPSTEMEVASQVNEPMNNNSLPRGQRIVFQHRPAAVDPSIRINPTQLRRELVNSGTSYMPHSDTSRVMSLGYGRPRSVNRSRTSTPLQSNVPPSPTRQLGALVHQIAGAALFDAQRRQALLNSSPGNRGMQNVENGHDEPMQTNSSLARQRVIGPSHFMSPGIFATLDDFVERAESRNGQRPSSAAGRRTPLGRQPVVLGQAAQIVNPGLNTARNWQTPNTSGNPFMRHRTSRRQLNNQNSPIAVRPAPSITALRNQGSRSNMRNNAPIPANRPPSRTQSRNQQRSLNHTPSMIHLPQSQAAQQIPSYSSYPTVVPPRARGPGQYDDNISRRITDAMDERAAMIARRQGSTSEDTPASNHRPAPAQHLTDLQTLRITSTNPFRGQQTTLNNHARQSLGLSQGYSNYTSNLMGTSHGQRLTPRRSRGNLAHGPPPGVIFSTTNATTLQNPGIQNNSQLGSTIITPVANSGTSPRLAHQRSRGIAANLVPQNPSFVPASTLHGSAQQERIWVDARTQVATAAEVLRQDPRLSVGESAAPRA